MRSQKRQDSHLSIGNTSASPLDEGWMQAFRDIDRAKGKNLLAQVAGIFFLRVPTLLENLEAALRGDNPEEAEEAAHSLASNYASVGALKLSQRCSDLEALVIKRETEAASQVLLEINSGYEEVRMALEEHLEQSKKESQQP